MILRSNIGANVQDAKTASLSGSVTKFHISRRHMARILLLGGRGGRGGDLCYRHVLGPTLSLIYFIVQTL